MKKEVLKELRDLSIEDLEKKLIESREEQFKVRLHQKTGKLDKTHEVRNIRRNIARIKQTICAKQKANMI